jgi:hypothetical protein
VFNSPVLNQAECGAGSDGSGENLSVKRKRRLLTLMFSVEVGYTVFSVEHPNHDTEEGRDYGHLNNSRSHLTYISTPDTG